MSTDDLSQKIRRRLQPAVRGIASTRKRDDLLDELESHVRESYERRVEEGQSPDAALEASLRAFGELGVVNRDLVQIYPAFYRRAGFWAGTAALCVVILFPVTITSVSRELARQVDARNILIQTRMDQLLEDQRRVVPFLTGGRETRTGRDAGPTLNFRIPWDSGQHRARVSTRSVPIDSPPDLGLIRPSADSSWIERLRELPGAVRIDTRWMKELARYEYWEPFRNSPFEYLLNEDPVNALSIPVPNYSRLREIAMVRLVQGMTETDPLRSLSDVRNLARLLATQEIIVAHHSALSLLTLERQAYDWLVAHGRLRAGDWTPFPPGDTERVHDAIRASMDVFDILNPTSAAEAFLKARPIGLCAGLSEGIIMGSLTRSFVQDRWPFETDYRRTLERVDSLLSTESHRCRLVVARAQWHHHRRDLDPRTFWMGAQRPPLSVRLLAHVATLPYLRRIAARVTWSITASLNRYWTGSAK